MIDFDNELSCCFSENKFYMQRSYVWIHSNDVIDYYSSCYKKNNSFRQKNYNFLFYIYVLLHYTIEK